MKKLICLLVGHKVKFSDASTLYVGYCKRCEHSIFEKRRHDRGEIIISVLALVAFLSVAVSDGIKNSEEVDPSMDQNPSVVSEE